MNALTQHKLYELAHELDGLKNFTPLIVPQVNINGTSAEALVDQQRIVLHNLDHLLHSMGEAMPHGRDWQTVEGGEKLADICRAAWLQRRMMLEILRREIETYAIAILDQPAARRKRMPPIDEFSTRLVQPGTVEVSSWDQAVDKVVGEFLPSADEEELKHEVAMDAANEAKS